MWPPTLQMTPYLYIIPIGLCLGMAGAAFYEAQQNPITQFITEFENRCIKPVASGDFKPPKSYMQANTPGQQQWLHKSYGFELTLSKRSCSLSDSALRVPNGSEVDVPPLQMATHQLQQTYFPDPILTLDKGNILGKGWMHGKGFSDKRWGMAVFHFPSFPNAFLSFWLPPETPDIDVIQ